MFRGRLLGLAGLALLSSPLAAEAPDPYEAKVRGLAHPRYAEREKAARELVAAGEPALKALKAALASPDEELRARAAAVADKIEHAARSKRLLNAPTLALKFDKTPLDQAVNEVAQKAGLRLMIDPSKIKDVKRPVTLDTGTVPFWDAVGAFYKAAGLTEDDNPAAAPRSERLTTSGMRASGRIYTSMRPGAGVTRLIDGVSVPSATGQVFRVRALPAGYGSNKFDDLTGEVTFHLDVDPVPTVDVQEILGVEVRRAVVDAGRVLAPAYPAREGNSFQFDGFTGQQIVIVNGDLMVDGLSGQAGPHFPVTLKAGGERPKQLAELHGAVVARIIAPPEPVLTVTDVFGKAKGQTFRAEGLTCQVTAANPAGEHLQTPARVPALPRPVGTAQSPEPPVAPHRVEVAAFSVRLVSTDSATETLSLPVQFKGKLRPFIRLNRRTTWESSANAPEFQVRDGDGKPLRVLATRVTESAFDGASIVQEVQLTIEKPAKGVDGTRFTLATRRPVVVEMPFVLKDVPLP